MTEPSQPSHRVVDVKAVIQTLLSSLESSTHMPWYGWPTAVADIQSSSQSSSYGILKVHELRERAVFGTAFIRGCLEVVIERHGTGMVRTLSLSHNIRTVMEDPGRQQIVLKVMVQEQKLARDGGTKHLVFPFEGLIRSVGA